MASQRTRGFQAERELVSKLWQHGFAVMRAPASGSGTRRIFYPDLIAIYKGRIFVIEVKYRTSEKSIYITREKMEKLRDFAQRAGAEVLVAIKFKRKGWYIARVADDCVETEKGCRISITSNNSITLDRFISSIINKGLDEYLK